MMVKTGVPRDRSKAELAVPHACYRKAYRYATPSIRAPRVDTRRAFVAPNWQRSRPIAQANGMNSGCARSTTIKLAGLRLPIPLQSVSLDGGSDGALRNLPLSFHRTLLQVPR